MAIAGETSLYIVDLAISDFSVIDTIIFTFKRSGVVTKTYPKEVTYQSGKFFIPLRQQDTISLQGSFDVQAQINYKNKAVKKTFVEKGFIDSTLATKIIDGNMPSGNEANITLTIEGNVIIASVGKKVQSDWNQTNSASESYIKNKPTIPIITNDLTDELKDNYDSAYTHSMSDHAPSDAQKNVQPDWNQTDTNADDYIKNKPDISGGGSGENGATFTPSVSAEGVISWTNDKELDNPTPINIRGPQGPAGATVAQITNLQDQIDDVKTFVGYEGSDVYGVEVDFAGKKFTRLAGAENLTAGADFTVLNPWNRKRCILADDGVVLAYRGDTGYTEAGVTTVEITKTVDGADKTYAVGTKVQVMVEQPIFYVKVVPVKVKTATSGKGKGITKARYYISPTPKVGFKSPEAFNDNAGIPQDKIYLSAFEGSIFDTSAGAYLKSDEQVSDFATDIFCSIAGAKPASGLTQNLTRANVRKLCNNRGAGWMSHNIYAISVTQWLILVEYASMDCQRKIGRGVCDYTDDGSTNMAVVTGATSGMGNNSGIPDGGVDGKCSVTYRGEENLWGNIWTWLDLINILAKGVNEAYLHKAGATVADDTTTGYDNYGTQLSHQSGYQSEVGYSEDYPELFLPTACAGTDALPIGDYYWQNYTYNGFLVAGLGGRWYNGSTCGAWYLRAGNISSGRSRDFGGRLLYVPQTNQGIQGPAGQDLVNQGEVITPTDGTVTLALVANMQYFVSGAISSLILTAPANYNPWDEFYIMFATSSTGCTVTPPTGWIYVEGSTASFDANKVYELNVKSGLIVCPPGTAVS